MRRKHLSAMITVATLTLAPTTTAGQSTMSAQPAQPIGAIVGGVLGAGAGFVGGALIGVGIGCDGGCREFEGLGYAVVGGVVGEVLFLPVGAHLGNGSSGNLARDVGVSLALGAGTLLLSGALESSALGWLGLVAQIGITVRTERVAGARRGAEVRIQSRALPDRRVGLGLQVRF